MTVTICTSCLGLVPEGSTCRCSAGLRELDGRLTSALAGVVQVRHILRSGEGLGHGRVLSARLYDACEDLGVVAEHVRDL